MSRGKVAEVTTYTVVLERDEAGYWVADFPDVPGCHTQGRTLRQVRGRLRDALSLFVSDAAAAKLAEELRVSPRTRALVEEAAAMREQVERVRALAREKTQEAAHVLVDDEGFSYRDAGEALHLSHQRVQQLVTKDLQDA